MSKVVFILLVILVGCGKTYPPPKQTIETELIDFVQKFEQRYNIKVNASIQFVDELPSPSVGVCHSYYANSPSNYIEIDKSYWDTLDYYGKEQLIYHELGHCVFDYGHDESVIIVEGYTIPKSIMYPICFGHIWFYEQYNEYYLQELNYE